MGGQIIIAGNHAPTWGAILYLFAMATQRGAAYNIIMIRVRRVEGAIKQKILGYAARRAQFYDFNAYLLSGYPNFTIMLAISAVETQLYSLDKALRWAYPYFDHI